MELNEFLKNFAECFDDTDASQITASTAFRELDEWSSLTGMSVIAMAKTVYGKTISGMELRSCETVESLFKLISSK